MKLPFKMIPLPAIPGLDEKGRNLVVIVFAASFLLAIITTVALFFVRGGGAPHPKAEVALHGELGGDIPDTTGEKGLETVMAPIDIEANRIAAFETGDRIPLMQKIEHLRRIASATPLALPIQIELATTLMRVGEYREAAALFERILGKSIDDSLGRVAKARYALVSYQLDEIETAISLLDQQLSAHPTDAEALCYRGEIAMAENLASDSAELFFKRALTAQPDYTEALYQYARYQLNRPVITEDNISLAMVSLQHLLSIEPLNSRALSRLAMTYQYAGNRTDARHYYEASLAVNPRDPNTCYNYGVLLEDQFDDLSGALTSYLAVLKSEPNHTEALFRIAVLSAGNNMNKEAVLYLTRLLVKSPRDTRALLQLAAAYEKLTMPSEALKNYRAVAAIDPLNEIALNKIDLMSAEE